MKYKTIFLLAAIIIFSIAFPMTANASYLIPNPDEISNINDGDGQYIKYSDNYHLDLKELGLMDSLEKGINAGANFFFGVFKELAHITVVIFYHCFSFDISEMFQDELVEIQEKLREIFFDGTFFTLIFATSAAFIIKQLLRGNLQNLFGEVIKVVAILVISLMVARQSATFLSFVNTTGKQISIQALGGISNRQLSSNNDNASLKEYAADVAAILWSGLVHKPWVALEFDTYPASEGEINTILSYNPGSAQRKDYIKTLNENQASAYGLFEKEMASKRLHTAFFMAIPILIKSSFYLVIALFQLGCLNLPQTPESRRTCPPVKSRV